MISKESLNQFKKMYEEYYEIQLTDKEALEIALRLLGLTKIALGVD